MSNDVTAINYLPGKLDLNLYKGDYFPLNVRLRSKVYDSATDTWTTSDPINLTGATVKAQIRASAGDPTILASFTATIADQTTNTGELLLELTSTDTNALPTTGTMVWDLEITMSASKPRTYLAGAVTVTKDVSV